MKRIDLRYGKVSHCIGMAWVLQGQQQNQGLEGCFSMNFMTTVYGGLYLDLFSSGVEDLVSNLQEILSL